MLVLAGVCYGPDDIRIEEQPQYTIGTGEVLVRVTHCGVCPSDVRIFAGRSSSAKFPTILGHESVGVVEAIGEGVRSVSPGQRIVIDPTRRCGRCATCRRGYENACENADYSRGSFAEYTLTWETNVYTLSDETPFEAAALTEPLACVLHGFRKARIGPGDSVLIVGAGPIGLMHLSLAKSAGAGVIVSEMLPERCESARTFGADAVLNPDQLDLRRPELPDAGFDAAVVAVGNVEAVQQVAPLMSQGGRLILFAGFYPPKPVSLDPNMIHYREIQVVGSFDCARWDFEQALRLIESGRLNVRGLISHRFQLTDLAKALKTVQETEGLKVMVDISQNGTLS